MTKYGVPVIIGLILEFVLGFALWFFIKTPESVHEFHFLIFAPLLLVIIGGFIAGILSKGGPWVIGGYEEGRNKAI